MGENTEKDTIYLTSEQLGEEPEILFQEEISGIFAEEAVRRHSFSMVSRHFHQSLELYFLLEGERFYFVEQDTYHMKEQMAILVDQNQIHKTCPAGNGKSHHRFLLQLEGEALSCLLKLCGFRGLLEFGEQYRGITCFFGRRMETGAGAAGKDKKRNEYVPKCTRMVRYGKENGGGDGAAVYGPAASASDTNQKQSRGGRMEGARTDQYSSYGNVSEGS